MRLILPIVFILLFLGWISYRLFIKKDLRQRRNDLYAGLSFLGIWVLIYLWIWS